MTQTYRDALQEYYSILSSRETSTLERFLENDLPDKDKLVRKICRSVIEHDWHNAVDVLCKYGANFRSCRNAIIHSVKDGDLRTLIALYKNGIDIDFNNNSILRSACYGGQTAIVWFLLYIVEVSPFYITENEDWTRNTSTLSMAIDGGNIDVMRMLIDVGANPADDIDRLIKRAVAVSIDNDDSGEMVRFLLPYCRSEHLHMPLKELVARKGKPILAELLISHLDDPYNHLENILTEASNFCNMSMIDYIENKYPNYFRDITDAVVASIHRNRHDSLVRYLNTYANIKTLLEVAIREDKWEAFKIIALHLLNENARHYFSVSDYLHDIQDREDLLRAEQNGFLRDIPSNILIGERSWEEYEDDLEMSRAYSEYEHEHAFGDPYRHNQPVQEYADHSNIIQPEMTIEILTKEEYIALGGVSFEIRDINDICPITREPLSEIEHIVCCTECRIGMQEDAISSWLYRESSCPNCRSIKGNFVKM